MQRRATQNEADGGGTARCTLWLPRGYDAPVDLVEGLRRREVRVAEVHDAPAVMVALAREREPAGHVLVIVEPSMLRSAEALRAAVAEYHPRVPVWRYDWQNRPALARWTDARERPEPAAPSAPPDDPLPRDLDPPPADDEPLLSEQELAMLLGDWPDESEGERA